VLLSGALATVRTPRYEATASLALLPETSGQQVFLAPDSLATLLSTSWELSGYAPRGVDDRGAVA
jgi:hypothetical protein